MAKKALNVLKAQVEHMKELAKKASTAAKKAVLENDIKRFEKKLKDTK